MTTLLAGLSLVLLGGLAAVILARWPRRAASVQRIATGAGALLALVSPLQVLGGANVATLTIPTNLPGGSWTFGLDALSAWFLIPVLLAGTATAIFGTAYLGAEEEHGSVPRAHLGMAVLLVALALVLTAQATLAFLASWEVMALAGYFLVVFEDRRPEVRRAGMVYLMATHAGTLLLVVGFALWGEGAADLSFASLAAAAPGRGSARAALLVLGLVGFGLKAGFVPLHFWLPEAHAAAPSHVSAIMSGVVIKTGIYGVLRLLVLLGAPPPWWSFGVLLLGGCSAVLGVLWALAQHDLKRLLAYHSVENIGIILLGLGAGALGLSYGLPLLAVLGFLGAVLHVLNHALFKSLLFLQAGSVLRATGSRDLERLGGLARRMPLTWLGFAVGSAAIVGLPPLNGFVSEWVVFQALFEAGSSRTPASLALFGAAALGLVGGLALACFAKVCGTVFLGHPRTPAAQAAREVGPGFWGPAAVLAAACVVLGVIPWLALGPAARVAGQLAGLPWPRAAELSQPVGHASRQIAILAACLTGTVAVLALARTLALRQAGAVATGETWACGYPRTTPRMQYSASSFAAPLVGLFGPLAGVTVHRRADGFATHPVNLALERILVPLWQATQRASTRLRPIQHGRLQLYLLYIVATVAVLLFYLATSGGKP